jgi:tRNA1(Val) A37 N6-methylase TrmN6
MIRMNSLELGAGGGLVGLGVAIGCEVDHTIYITDQENMLSLMAQNVNLNGLSSRVVPLVLNWYPYLALIPP